MILSIEIVLDSHKTTYYGVKDMEGNNKVELPWTSAIVYLRKGIQVKFILPCVTGDNFESKPTKFFR